MEFSRPQFGVLPPATPTILVQRERRFARLLAFAGRTIDDVVNCPVAKREVYNWYKTDRRLHRQLEVIDLERQWNGVK